MKTKIESKQQTVEDFFKNMDGKFIIPEYQRPYDWDTKEQIERFWQDLFYFSTEEDKKTYFLGSAIMSVNEPDDLILIDGQQRTTTLILLLKALLIKINNVLDTISDDEDNRKLKDSLDESKKTIILSLYNIDNGDDRYYDIIDNKIGNDIEIKYSNNSINEKYAEDITKILQGNSLKEIESKVEKIKYKKGNNRYTKFYNNFNFFMQKLDELQESQINSFAKAVLKKTQIIEIISYDQEEAFEIFNSLNSTGLPLADADIISAKLYGFYNKENQNNFNDKWGELIESIEQLEKENIVDIDSILNQYMYIKRVENEEKSTTLPSVRKYFTVVHKDLLEDGDDFVSSLQTIANNWNLNSRDPDNQYILKLLLKFNSNFKFFYASYLFFKDNDGNTTKLNYSLTLLKLFILLDVGDSGYSSKNFKQFLINENMKLKQDDTNHIIREFENHIQNSFDKEQIKSILKEKYADGKLVNLNEYLFAKEKGIEPKFLLSDIKVEIEHILPASGKNISSIRKDAGFEGKDDFDNHKDTLGNKILLEARINKKIGNAQLDEKINGNDNNKEDGYKKSEYPIAQSLSKTEKKIWRKNDIEDATEKSANRIVNFIFSTIL